MASCNQTYVCFIDFEKTFDRVNSQRRFQKLLDLGLPEDFLLFSLCLLKENISQLETSGYLLDPITRNSGVAQGEKLPLLLFSLHISDLDRKLNECNAQSVFYADDLAFCQHSLDCMQNALDNLSKFCEINSMKVNVPNSKTSEIQPEWT